MVDGTRLGDHSHPPSCPLSPFSLRSEDATRSSRVEARGGITEPVSFDMEKNNNGSTRVGSFLWFWCRSLVHQVVNGWDCGFGRLNGGDKVD
ncbi:hypothetical protein TNCV_3073001 [Trichonephila clavipes]|nr:hypothetical protein TNCV_3073001 [Trichonephila clavipes]